jgi:hypothetical protein
MQYITASRSERTVKVQYQQSNNKAVGWNRNAKVAEL